MTSRFEFAMRMRRERARIQARVQKQRWIFRETPYAALDHVKHFRAAGEDRFLCGVPVGRDDATDRPAYTSDSVSCNRCQVIHNKLRATPEGQRRVGLDRQPGRPIG